MRGKGATPAASIQLHMVIQFPITGSCPYWALADPSAVAGSLLVDEGYVLDHFSEYVEELKGEAFRGNVLLVSSGIGDRVRIHPDEEPEGPSPLSPVLEGSYLRIPSGRLVCSMLHKLPTSRTDKNSVHASIPSGVYRLDAFSTPVQGSRRRTEVVIRLARCGAEPPETFAAPYIPNAAMEAGTTSKARSPFVQLLYEIVLGRSRR